LYDRTAMVASKWARWLAPIALAAVAAGTYTVVHSSLADHHSVTAGQTTVVHSRRKPRGKLAKARIYVVRSGDSLSAIAAKTGVSIAALEALNPTISPDSLQTGQRLRLRR
jgi:LysM repeat protein